MAKKTEKELEDLFKKTFADVKGSRESGWEAHDSERVILPLIAALSDKDGKDVKLSADRLGKIQAALQITPARILKTIKTEVEAAGAVMDEVTENNLLWLVDLPKVRLDLTEAGVLQKAGKGKKAKKKVVDLLK